MKIIAYILTIPLRLILTLILFISSPICACIGIILEMEKSDEVLDDITNDYIKIWRVK